MPSSTPESPSHLLFLLDEILQHVLNDVVAGIVTNQKTGYPYPYYASNYRDSQKDRRRNLVNLCLSCRKVNAIATPLLYRDVFLNKLNQPEYSEEEERNDAADEGVFTLGLFLRTMLERPELRAHVRHLDCWFILSPVLDYETDPLPGLDTYRIYRIECPALSFDSMAWHSIRAWPHMIRFESSTSPIDSISNQAPVIRFDAKIRSNSIRIRSNR
ncbi:hypothetical protein EDB80DRAFT_693096 [Ilyonectria destructans]|nr:hypothetical protein EDB80DRAFT_693096 [Ilyonectria destructans]